MKVLVTVKEVSELAEDFEVTGTRVDEKYLEYDLNEWDDYAVEEAVQISETEGDVDVVAVTIGPERTEETIRMALAKGVDRAVRVWDDALDDVDVLDVRTKTEILAAVAAQEEPDLVLTGVQAGDDAFGATGVSLADEMGFEWAAVVNALDLDVEGGGAHVHRELEGGVDEVTDVELPAVLTIQTGLNEPRYASLRGIRQAQSKEIKPMTLADIGLEPPQSDLTLADMYEPETESTAEIFEGDASETAGKLATVLREKGVDQ